MTPTEGMQLKLFSDHKRDQIMKAVADPAILPVGIPNDLLNFVTLETLDAMVGKIYRVTSAKGRQSIYRMEGYHLCRDYVLDHIQGNNHYSTVLNKNGQYLDAWHVVDRRNGERIYAQQTQKTFITLASATSNAVKSEDWIWVSAVSCYHHDELYGPIPPESKRKPGIQEIKLLIKPKRK